MRARILIFLHTFASQEELHMKTLYKALILFILIAGAAFFATEYMAVYEPGFTVTSVTTSPNIITPSTDLNSATFLINTVFDAGGQSIVGYLSPDEIKAESGYETEYTLGITAQAVDEVVDYPIVNQPNLRMHQYSLEFIETSIFNQNPACPVKTDERVVKQIFVTGTLSGMKYCVYEKDVGAIGYLDNPTTSFNTKISLNARGQTFTEELNSFDATSVIFYDNGKFLANAKWTGSLVTGNLPPSEALYVATYRTDRDNAWHIAYKSKLDGYTYTTSQGETALATVTQTTECLNKDYAGCQINIERTLSSINTALETLSTGAEPGIGDVTTKINPNSLTGSTPETKPKLRATFDRQFGNPQVTFLVNAAWVGIKFGVGQPEIVSVYCPDFSSGDNIGVCDVLYKNVGEAEGAFRASFIPAPSSDFRQQNIVTSTLLQPGESTNVNVYISHGTSVAESSIGTIKVSDVNDPSRYDTMEASLTMTEPKSCIPGMEEARGQSIYKCNVAGTGWDLVTTCEEGSIPKLNEAGTNLECVVVDVVVPGLDAIFDDLMKYFFGEDFDPEDLLTLIILIVMVIVILYLAAITLPILIPLIGKAIIGLLIGRK